jgi:membrane carboxypeptidase/penicillin-binding protein
MQAIITRVEVVEQIFLRINRYICAFLFIISALSVLTVAVADFSDLMAMNGLRAFALWLLMPIFSVAPYNLARFAHKRRLFRTSITISAATVMLMPVAISLAWALKDLSF